MMKRQFKGATWIGWLLACHLAAAATPPGDAALKQFQQTIASYTTLRDSQGKITSRSTDAPGQIAYQRHELADRMRQARSGAKEGDVFTPPVADLFRRRLQEAFTGPQGKQIRTSLKHAEPVRGIRLAVNDSYPQKLPLQSTPPSLLLNLPPVSKGLQYRIVGRDLVLLDINTNLVIDFLRNAIPTQENQK